MILNNIYIYVNKNNIKNFIKYGIKLTEHANITFKKSLFYKKGIIAYFSPKDNLEKYNNKNLDILRIKLNKDMQKNIYVINNNNLKLIIPINEYFLGMFEEPNIIISTSIFQDSIFNYNRILDVPLLISNSKEIYNDIKENKKYEEESYNIIKARYTK